MERTKHPEQCSTEKMSYDLCVRMKIFDYKCVLEKFVFQRCQTQAYNKDSKEKTTKLFYNVELERQ